MPVNRMLRNRNDLPRTSGHAKGLSGGEAARDELLPHADLAFAWLSHGKVVFISESLDALLEEYARLNDIDA